MTKIPLALTCAGLVSFLSAQTPHTIFRHADTRPPGTLAAGADLDGDGTPDQVASVDGPGSTVLVFSGRTGIARQLGGAVPDQLGRYIALLGDVDRDGASDLALGAPADATHGAGAGAVYVLSGRTLRRLAVYRGSAGDGLGPCARLGDLDGDGTADLAVAAPRADFPATDAGVVYVLSGRTLQVLRSHIGAAGQQLGEHMLEVEDQDRDGVHDYLLSLRGAAGHSFDVISGRTGLRLSVATLPVAGSVDVLAPAGDTDNDGRADVAVGVPDINGGLGAIVVLSGNGLGVLLNLAGLPNGTIGHGVAAAGDFDGDRHGDIAVLSEGLVAVLTVRSGRTGAVLATISTRSQPAAMQPRVVAAGDVNGDGIADVFASGATPPAFAMEVLSTKTLVLTASLHRATAGVPFMQTMNIEAGAAAVNGFFLLLSSASGTAPGFRLGSVAVPLNPDGLLFHALTNPNRLPYVLSLARLDALGRGHPLFGNFVPWRELAGLVIHHAVILTDASANVIAASNAVALTFVDDRAATRSVEEGFASDAQLDRERSSGLRFGDLAFVGGTGLHGDFDHRLGADLGGGVFEFDLQRDTRGGVLGFAIPASRTLSGREEFVTDGTFQFASLSIPAGITVRFVGATPARILVRGQVAIDGVVDASGARMAQVPFAFLALGQAGGRPGCGGGRGGNGADASNGTTVSNGENGQDVRVAAGHAYAGRAAGTGGAGAGQYPANNAAVTHNYLTSCAQVPAGAGGGGNIGAGGNGVAIQSPATPPELGPSNAGGTAFQLFPLPNPTPPSFQHFLVGGAGGGGGGSHIYGHRTSAAMTWKIGAGGSGGGGAFGVRAGHDFVCGPSSALRARGGEAFAPYLHQIQGPPGPAGGGSGGTFVLQSAVRVVVQDIDVRGAAGLWVQPGATPALRIEARGGDGAAGFYRVESPSSRIVNANPPVTPDNTSILLDRDPQAGQQSKWYSTGTAQFARFVRFEIDAVRGGVNLRLSDDLAIGPAPRFGDPTAPLWFKLQGARADHVGNVEPGSETAWRDRAVDLQSAGADLFRFVLLRNDPTIQVRRVRVLVSD